MAATNVLTVTATDALARTGVVHTAHGDFAVPAFMPVATHGSVKGVTSERLAELGTEIVLSNTYHLYLHPGHEHIEKLGGLHAFMHWPGPILTDSGGFQVFSLGHRTNGAMAKITDDGVTFVSHRDGSRHEFTPHKVIDIQRSLGVDIMMPLDECPPSDADDAVITTAVTRTHRWLADAVAYWQEDPRGQLLFGIAQGGTNKDLRTQSIDYVSSLPVSGVALGGLAVGEGRTNLYQTVQWAAPLLPADRPRYLMGVGYPKDVLFAVGQGIDMFDCVVPTRLARHGSVWVVEGDADAVRAFYERDTDELVRMAQPINIVRRTFPHTQFATDMSPLQPEYPTTPLGSLTHAYANHQARENEIQLAVRFSEQNIRILQLVLQHARAAIARQQYAALAQIFGVDLLHVAEE